MVAQTNGKRRGKFVAILAAAKAQVRVGRLQSKDASERVAGGQRPYLGGGGARGVEGANQRTHAGSGDAVYGNVVLLKPFEDAYVRQAQRPAALQRNTDSRTAPRLHGRQDRAVNSWGGNYRFLRCGGDWK